MRYAKRLAAQVLAAMNRGEHCVREAASVAASSCLVPQALALLSGYQLLLTAVAARRHARGLDRTLVPDRVHHRFVIVVPAHDEELLIASTVASMRGLDYPEDLFRIHVIADNCSDATAEIARAAGAEVHERFAPDKRGKGPALQWLLQRLWTRGDAHDAVVIVDADSTLSANFLRVMDAKLAEGHRVVQGYYAVRDPGTSWNVGLRYAGFALRHYLRPLARTAFGGSCGLYGNGMAFRSEMFCAIGRGPRISPRTWSCNSSCSSPACRWRSPPTPWSRPRCRRRWPVRAHSSSAGSRAGSTSRADTCPRFFDRRASVAATSAWRNSTPPSIRSSRRSPSSPPRPS